MSIIRRFLLLGTAACVAAAGTIAATSASADAEPNAGLLTLNDKGVLVFTAGDGVANDMTTGGTLDPILGLTDKAANINVDQSAAAMCKSFSDPTNVQRPTNTVRCTGKPGQIINVTVNLGDRGDRYAVESAYPDVPELKGAGYIAVTVHGGADADVLDATNAGPPVTFYGEAGRDRLIGGRHADLLDAGSTPWWFSTQQVIGNGGTDTCKGASMSARSCER